MQSIRKVGTQSKDARTHARQAGCTLCNPAKNAPILTIFNVCFYLIKIPYYFYVKIRFYQYTFFLLPKSLQNV
jgi:hypothetical protein